MKKFEIIVDYHSKIKELLGQAQMSLKIVNDVIKNLKQIENLD